MEVSSIIALIQSHSSLPESAALTPVQDAPQAVPDFSSAFNISDAALSLPTVDVGFTPKLNALKAEAEEGEPGAEPEHEPESEAGPALATKQVVPDWGPVGQAPQGLPAPHIQTQNSSAPVIAPLSRPQSPLSMVEAATPPAQLEGMQPRGAAHTASAPALAETAPNPAMPVNGAAKGQVAEVPSAMRDVSQPPASLPPIGQTTHPQATIPPVIGAKAPQTTMESSGLSLVENPAQTQLDVQVNFRTERSVVEAAHTPQVEGKAPPNLASQLSTQLPNLLKPIDKQTVELRLDPPELGRVTIQVNTADSTVSAQVSAERADTLDLMRRHADLLVASMAKAGFSHANLSFQQGQHQHAEQSEGPTIGLQSPTDSDEPIAPFAPTIIDGALDIRL